ncbi:MAG: hypothetical protein WC091_16130 [Sulfuricellaceae bacterium]
MQPVLIVFDPDTAHDYSQWENVVVECREPLYFAILAQLELFQFDYNGKYAKIHTIHCNCSKMDFCYTAKIIATWMDNAAIQDRLIKQGYQEEQVPFGKQFLYVEIVEDPHRCKISRRRMGR